MKVKQITVLLYLVCLAFLGCSDPEMDSTEEVVPIDEPVIDEVEEPIASHYLPFYQLGSELKNDTSTVFESTTVVVDSSSLYKFDVNSYYNTGPNSVVFSIKVQLKIDESVRFLNRLAGGIVYEGPILSSFNKGDTISIDMPKNEVVDWFTDYESELRNTGWFKSHIYTEDQGWFIDNLNIGENYLVIKFGDENEERLGWLNVMYQDTLCYIKEGYYNQSINEDIIIGAK